MIVPFFTARKRRRLLAQPLSPTCTESLETSVPVYARLPDDQKRNLQDIARVLVAEKNWEGCGELSRGKLTCEMKLVIAAQAGLLLLGQGLDPLRDDLYPNVESVLVYPRAFVSSAPRSVAPVGPLAIMTDEGQTNLGEAWQQNAHGGGPVILSWADAQRGGQDPADGHNVVLHEFAHKLDMLDGSVNGTPLLESRDQLDQWKTVMTSEYIQLSRSAAMGMPTIMNPYGATSPGEFFAVATETFFEKPREMQQHHTMLYDTLKGFYKVDPVKWT